MAEDPLFYATPANPMGFAVHKRPEQTSWGTVLGFRACVCDEDAYAEQIARALNRLPVAERMLIEVAAIMRSGDADRANKMADAIEEWFINE